MLKQLTLLLFKSPSLRQYGTSIFPEKLVLRKFHQKASRQKKGKLRFAFFSRVLF